MGILRGKVGFIRPTFDEYPTRYSREDSVSFTPDNRDYSYTADDIIAYFDKTDIGNLVLVNPEGRSSGF